MSEVQDVKNDIKLKFWLQIYLCSFNFLLIFNLNSLKVQRSLVSSPFEVKQFAYSNNNILAKTHLVKSIKSFCKYAFPTVVFRHRES